MLGTGENRAHLPLMDAIAIDLAVMEPDGPDDAMGKEAGARFVPHTGEGRNVAIFRNPARKGAERHVDPKPIADRPGRRGECGAALRAEQRRVGTTCVSAGRNRWWPEHEKKKQ